jgi:DNA-directed RNA polymerase specialized sigma24 family protein
MGTVEDSSLKGKRFPTTRWSLVLAARGTDDEGARRALEALCQAYWTPLYSYARQRGNSPEKAEDLVQGLFLALIRRKDFAQVDAEKGRLRNYLKTAFDHHESDVRDEARTMKRGGGTIHLSWEMDFDASERAYQATRHPETSPDDLYVSHWARKVLDTGLERLRGRYVGEGRGGDYDRLVRFIAGDLSDETCKAAASRLGYGESAFKMAKKRIRQRFGEALRDVIAETVADASQVEDEVRVLLSVLKRV